MILFRLNRKTWKLYVPIQIRQQLQEQAACCIGVQALLNALAINFEIIESGKLVFTHQKRPILNTMCIGILKRSISPLHFGTKNFKTEKSKR